MDNTNTENLGSPVVLSEKFETIEVENPAQLIESPIKDESVSKFNCPVEFAPPILSTDEAREKILEALIKAAKTLPKGEAPETIANRIRAILVPYWEQKGWITAGWRATGITVERWTVNCIRCGGRGKVGRGKNNKSCPGCHGSGKEKRSKDKKNPEKGATSAEIVTEFVPNFIGDIKFKFEPVAAINRIPLSDKQLSEFSCIPAGSFDWHEQQSAFQDRLKDQWNSNVTRTLSTYDRIEGLTPDRDTIKAQSDISAFLYPAYICWYKKGAKFSYIICDALTGEITLPSKAGYYAKRVFNFIFKAAMLVVGLSIVLMVIGLIFGAPKTTTSPPLSSTAKPEASVPAPEVPKAIDPPKPEVKKSALNGEPVQKAWREGMIAINQAIGVKLSKYADDPDAQAKVRADNVFFERASDQKCGVVPTQILDAMDSATPASMDEKAIFILSCHIEEGKKRLISLSTD